MSQVSFHGQYISFVWENLGIDQLVDSRDFISDFRRKLDDEMTREAGIVQRAFERTVATWDTPVKFYLERSRHGNEFSFTVYTDSDIYRYINDGTAVRHALMPADYRPKSQVRVIGSRSGGGMPLKISKSIVRPGIAAREYVDEIANRREEFFYRNMERIYYDTIAKHLRIQERGG